MIKKTLALLLLLSMFSYSQSKKTYISRGEVIKYLYSRGENLSDFCEGPFKRAFIKKLYGKPFLYIHCNQLVGTPYYRVPKEVPSA